MRGGLPHRGAISEQCPFTDLEYAGPALAAGNDAADAGWFSATESARLPLTAGLAGVLDRDGLLPQGPRHAPRPAARPDV